MTHYEKNERYGDKLDFTQRFMIGRGTGTEATMDNANEVTVYLYRDMDDMASHFCHVYDRETRRITEGCQWKWEFHSGRDPLAADIWHAWT